MFKRIIIIVSLFVIMFSAVFVYYNYTKANKGNNNTNIIKSENPSSNEIKEDNNIETNNTLLDNFDVKKDDDMVIDTSVNDVLVQEESKPIIKADDPIVDNQSSEKKEEIKTEESKQQSEAFEQPVIVNNDDNTPLDSWERVDYSIDIYGTLDNAYNACLSDGDKIEGPITYACNEVISKTGKLLGIMLITEELTE